MVVRLALLFLAASLSTTHAQGRLNIVWPTPNGAYAEGRPAADYVQPTVSGLVESAFFGCVRNSGARYHEGVDLKPIARDSRSEALDPIYSVMDGVVLYANSTPGNSSYGRYIIIEHPHVEPAVMTLYAHLASIHDAVRPGAPVKAGTVIGIMGRSAGGYTIPKERAHLHFGIGLWMTEEFQSWYKWKKYTSPNTHGTFNGLNMIGMNPIEFYDLYRAGTVTSFLEYIEKLPVAYTIRVKSKKIPDFVRRYPALVEGAIPARGPGGWEIDFTSYGLPKRLRAIPSGHASLEQRERSRVISHDAKVLAEHGCRDTVKVQRGRATIDSHTERTLQLLFGFR